jgi:hypothetical protein
MDKLATKLQKLRSGLGFLLLKIKITLKRIGQSQKWFSLSHSV